MRKALQWTVVLAAIISFSGSTPLQATTFYYDDQYFDCAMNEVTFCWTNCAGGGACSGDRHGEFWYHETTRCSDDATVSQQWYHWNGSQWVAISGPPSPTC
jgi:hypothetical protein